MSKLITLALIVMISFLTGAAQGTEEKMSSKYKTVRGYEIREGILAIPRYSSDGEVCEIGLERLHYTPDKLYVESGLSHAEIDQIINEFFPDDSKGKPLPDMGLSVEVGFAAETIDRYENVTIRYDYPEPPPERSKHSNKRAHDEFRGYTVAVITWTHRKCQ